MSKPLSTHQQFVFIGCSKAKYPTGRSRVTPEELYNSPLFRKRVVYAKSQGLPWAVLSAKYGLWWPDITLKTYDLVLNSLPAIDRAAWHVSVANFFLNSFEDDRTQLDHITVEIHAGKMYCHPLAEILELLGVQVDMPCEGLMIGETLKLYTTGKLATTEGVSA